MISNGYSWISQWDSDGSQTGISNWILNKYSNNQ